MAKTEEKTEDKKENNIPTRKERFETAKKRGEKEEK